MVNVSRYRYAVEMSKTCPEADVARELNMSIPEFRTFMAEGRRDKRLAQLKFSKALQDADVTKEELKLLFGWSDSKITDLHSD